MKTFIIIASTVVFTSLNAQTPTNAQRVLFIGNSYTYGNNLPQLVKSVSQSVGDDITFDSNLIGGMSLKMHSTNATTLAKIQQGNWDYVVLQDQSQIPAFPESYVQANVYPYATQLNNLITTHNPCAETVFYMTWGRQNGDASNCSYQPPMCTYEGMDDLLKQRYLHMANTNHAITSPVGAVWRSIRTLHPTINLYETDESHPNIVGSYAAALTFYTTIFRKNPETITYVPSGVTAQDASILKSVVKNIVYDQLNQWYIGAYDTKAQFSFTQNASNPLSYNFQNTSQFGDTYTWDFGDGTTSILEHPNHQYANSGIYTVTLNATKCGITSTKTVTLDTTLLSTNESTTSAFSIYPNPTQDYLYLKSDKNIKNLVVTDAAGRVIKVNYAKEKIDVRNLKTGLYYLKMEIKNEENTSLLKFIKK